jgi:hypothetical protein
MVSPELIPHAHYVPGLGALDRRRRDESRREMAECLKLGPDHLGAKTALGELTGQEWDLHPRAGSPSGA